MYEWNTVLFWFGCMPLFGSIRLTDMFCLQNEFTCKFYAPVSLGEIKDQTNKQKTAVNEIQTEDPIIVHPGLVTSHLNTLDFQSSFSSK